MNKPGTLLCSILLFVACKTVQASPPPSTQPHSEGFWRARISRVHRGMRRSAVEKILPVRSSPQENEVVPGGRYSFYAVNSEWMVKVPYDFQGYVADAKKNPHQVMRLYDNRVIGPIQLVHHHTEIQPFSKRWSGAEKSGGYAAESCRPEVASHPESCRPEVASHREGGRSTVLGIAAGQDLRPSTS